MAALAWRLSQGPLEAPWFARLVAEQASAPGRLVRIDRAALSWASLAETKGAALRIQLQAVSINGPLGDARLAMSDVTLPVWPLFRARLEPETVALDGLRLRLRSIRPGSSEPPADPGSLLQSAANPAPEVPWGRLRHLHLRDATAEFEDAPVRLARVDIDLDRPSGGGLLGKAEAMVAAADQRATVSLQAHVSPDGHGTDLEASLSPISPARLAHIAPQAAALAALDAPVTLSGTASLGPSLNLVRGKVTIAVGEGTIHAGQGTAPVLAAEAQLSGTPDRVELRLISLETAASPTAKRTRFSGQASARTSSGPPGRAPAWQVGASLDVDRVEVADLAALWPEGTGGPGTRPWMTKNITAGRMVDGHVDVDLSVPADLSDVSLSRIAGHIDGHDLSVHWLRPVPPLEHGEARLTVSDPDVIDIAVTSATQAGGRHGGIRYAGGSVHLTGIAGTSQYAEIHTGLAGPLADLLAVLGNPRIKLLDKRPLPMRNPSGEVMARVHVGRLPLRDDVALDDLVIDTTAHTTRVHLGGIAAGFDLDGGTLDLAASNSGLTVDGTAALAGFPSRLKIGMDFRAGPPDQVQEKVTVHTTVAMNRLSALGLRRGAASGRPDVGGSAEVDATLATRRDKRTDIAVAADLTPMSLAEPMMGVDKRRGEAGSARVGLVLENGKLVSVGRLRVEAPGISVLGDAEMVAGRPVGLRLERLKLGTGTDLRGEVRMPTDPTDTISLRLAGPSLNLSPMLGGANRPSLRDEGDGPGRPWSADLAIDRVILGPGRSLTGLRAIAESDGRVVRRASVSGRVPERTGDATIRASIVADSGGRRLAVDMTDAGAILQAADGSKALMGGRMRVTGRWADEVAGRPFAGLAELADFRVRDAPTIGRVLKALTIYGLVDLARGPGVGFSRLVAPFSFERGVLSLRGARATSASLGLTASGRIDLQTRRADLTGTVVPAYFFNSLPGRLPLIGGLFRAEKGGGLFAATVRITGPLDEPAIRVNPLSALAPGALRGLFERKDGAN